MRNPRPGPGPAPLRIWGRGGSDGFRGGREWVWESLGVDLEVPGGGQGVVLGVSGEVWAEGAEGS